MNSTVVRLVSVCAAMIALCAGCVAAPVAGGESSLEPTSTAPGTVSGSPDQPLPQESATPSATATFDRRHYSLDDPDSLWVVVNKARGIQPNEYQPADLQHPAAVVSNRAQQLREPAAAALTKLVAAAKAQGVTVHLASGFRDVRTQRSLFQTYSQRDGQAAADRYSARPGHSEHQTGLAFDAEDGTQCRLEQCFETTKAGQWLATNAADFGFVLRFPAGKEAITGYMYEPWHFRFVGVELAQEMRRTQVSTLEEFFGLAPAPNYRN